MDKPYFSLNYAIADDIADIFLEGSEISLRGRY